MKKILKPLIVAICLREKFVGIKYFALALLLGFVAYGLSIFFYIKAQGIIREVKTSAYYAIASFIGTLLSYARNNSYARRVNSFTYS